MGVDNMSVYESIIKGLNEAFDYEKGQGDAKVSKCTVDSPQNSETKQKEE